jgi:hypothetical protein
MKKFWSDYAELWSHSNRWMKEHWKGYIILCAVIWGLTICWLYSEKIITKVKSIFCKDKTVKGEWES